MIFDKNRDYILCPFKQWVDVIMLFIKMQCKYELCKKSFLINLIQSIIHNINNPLHVFVFRKWQPEQI